MILGALLVSACSSDSIYLPALRDDPMAQYSHPGLVVVSKTEIPKGEDFTGGPVRPSVTTRFTIRGNQEAIASDAVSAAKADGWIFHDDAPVATGSGGLNWSAEKEMSEGLAGLDITLRGPSDDVDFSIRLSFREEY